MSRQNSKSQPTFLTSVSNNSFVRVVSRFGQHRFSKLMSSTQRKKLKTNWPLRVFPAHGSQKTPDRSDLISREENADRRRALCCCVVCPALRARLVLSYSQVTEEEEIFRGFVSRGHDRLGSSPARANRVRCTQYQLIQEKLHWWTVFSENISSRFDYIDRNVVCCWWQQFVQI